MLELPPIYPITDAKQSLSLSEQVLRFGNAGFPIVQFRGKPLSVSCQWQELRKALIQSADNGGWPLIVVNDRADLAVLAADDGLVPWGVHLGQTDLPPCEAALLPGLENVHFGTSTHNPDEWSSVDSTCDHAGVGPLRATPTKQNHAEIIGFDGLHSGCVALRSQNIAPIAIGGLTMDDVADCFLAGAESLAMTQTLSNCETQLTEYLWQAQKQKYEKKAILKKCRGVVIVGGSGAGKTTLAECLAQRMGLPSLDLDTHISQKTGKTIPELFDCGEALFRSVEAECLPECMEHPTILALGAGAWQQETVRQFVNGSYWDVLWLAENPKTAWERVELDTNRPLASDRAGFMKRWRSRITEWSRLSSLLPLGRSSDELAGILVP